MADKMPCTKPLECTANTSTSSSSSTSATTPPCADSSNVTNLCPNCQTGVEQPGAAIKQLDLDEPQQLLTPSVAIPLPPPPSLVTPVPLEIPLASTSSSRTTESESQTDNNIDEGIDTNDCCSDLACDQAAHDNDPHGDHHGLVSCDNAAFEANETITQNMLTTTEKMEDQPIDNDQPDDTKKDEITVNPKYIGEAEVSVVQIHDKLIAREALESTGDSSESEEDDQLKPLIVDNHQECYLAKRQIQQIIQQNNVLMKDLTGSVENDNLYINSPCHRQTHYLIDKTNSGDYSDLQSSDETASKDLKSETSSQLPDGVKEIDTLSPEEIPDDRLAEEIVENVEFYFSNDNILKDAFLLKHVRRNKEGFVSLKLVSSFKRVRQLTKDWRAVGHAIRRMSRKIELNDLATKIRRIDPLPTFDETMPSRTIVACDLPVDKLCIERVSDIFSKCGEIALIRILRPGAGIPVDVRQFMNKYPEMQSKECALVEFVESQSARNALNLDGQYKVLEMVAPKKKTGKKAVTVTKLVENYKFNDNHFERNRGGIMQQSPMDNDFNKFNLRRNTDYYLKPDHAHMCTQRRFSFNPNGANNNNTNANMGQPNSPLFSAEQQTFIPYQRRTSNFSVGSNDNLSRKYSSCSDGYSSCSEYSRRHSAASTASLADSRRASNCSDYCPCSRRGSGCGGNLVSSPNLNVYNNELLFRRMSSSSTSSQHGNGGIGPEFNSVRHHQQQQQQQPLHHSNGSFVSHYDRSFSHPQDLGRRISIDSNTGVNDRKLSTGSNTSGDRSIMHDSGRRYSNGFDPNRKLSNSDQYFNGRRLSTDSGYDRRMSFGSDYSSSPRSRSGSFLMCQHKNSETVVRTPIGPDGSKGFASRARKPGQAVSPV